jgi:peptide/nickel transport system permease protein
MLRYALNRLLLSLPTLILVSAAVFLLMRLVPGDPVVLMLGDQADPQQAADMRAAMGLDRSVFVQYGLWLLHAVSGDLGRSTTNDLPVLPLVLSRFQVTATIVFVAVAIAAVVAIPLGTVAAWRQNTKADFAIVSGATLLLSVPSFWLGLLMLLFFGLKLGWVPVVGYVSFAEDALSAALYIVLPVATLTLIEIGILTRMARAAAIDVLRLEYVAHARAKGLPESRVLRRHVLPNAFAPTLTLIGIVLGNLLGGVAVIETVFTLPGLGRLLVDGIYARDYPVVQGCMLFIATVYVVVNLLVDLAYPFFDPRVTASCCRGSA